MAGDAKLGIVVDTDTRATRQEFSSLRREIKREAEGMGGDWETAAAKIEDALKDAGARDDLIDAAKRIGREGPSEIEKMQRALKDVGDDSRTLSDDIDDAASGIKGSLDDAAKGIKDSFEENALTPEDVFGAELKAELVSNMVETGSEVVRGFKDGFDAEDASTVIDGLTDTMAAVGALSGPVGAAAGLAGGAVVQAFAGPFIAEAEAKAEQFEETFASAFANIVESGAQMGRELTITEVTNKLTEDTDKLNQVTETSNMLGVERGIIFRAMAGDTDALNVVTERAAELNGEQARLAKLAGEEMLEQGHVSAETADALNDLNQKLKGQHDLLGSVTSSYENNTDALNAATEATEAKSEADAYAAEKMIDLKRKLAESKGEAEEFTVTIDGATRTLKAMPDGKVVDVEAEGVELTQAEIDGISGSYVSVHAYSTGTAQASRDINSAAYPRSVPLNLTGSYWQAQYEADRVAASVRPPSIRVNMTYGMRAV